MHLVVDTKILNYHCFITVYLPHLSQAPCFTVPYVWTVFMHLKDILLWPPFLSTSCSWCCKMCDWIRPSYLISCIFALIPAFWFMCGVPSWKQLWVITNTWKKNNTKRVCKLPLWLCQWWVYLPVHKNMLLEESF